MIHSTGNEVSSGSIELKLEYELNYGRHLVETLMNSSSLGNFIGEQRVREYKVYEGMKLARNK